MLVYNVLFKGVDTPESSCKVFASYAEADKYVVESIIVQSDRNWTIMSTSGWRSEIMPTGYDKDFMPVFANQEKPELIIGNFTDYRLEDKYNDSYYFVIYVQSINEFQLT
tara:strand:- start:16888 stop:17217 length:330 start_codon:yes stop_codon:yes gene_type:complete